MEGWKVNKEKEEKEKDGKVLTPESKDLEIDLQNLEDESRRKDLKWKEEEGKEGRRRKTKLPRLEGWGEKEEEMTIQNPVRAPTEQVVASVDVMSGPDLVNVPVKKPQNTAQRNMVDAGVCLEIETCKMLAKKGKLKVEISQAVTKKKFKFNKRGALKDAEVKELRRTHATNIFSWVSRDTKIRMENMIQSEIETEMHMDCQDEHLER